MLLFLFALRRDFTLFAQIVPTPEPPSSPALDRLAAIDPDELSPKQALEALYELKKWL